MSGAVRLWRISDFADLSGQGGLVAPARWHSAGRRVVYLADHPASALIEVLVHFEVDTADMPDMYQLLAVDVPDDLAFDVVDDAKLPDNWRTDDERTRAAGDQWLNDGRTSLLRVPSAIAPFCWNWLLNPLHADAAQARIAAAIQVAFDPRLLR